VRKGTLTAALEVLAVVCAACSGMSHSSTTQHTGTTSLGPGGATSGHVSMSPATEPSAARPGGTAASPPPAETSGPHGQR
jgi:hypothetical protein